MITFILNDTLMQTALSPGMTVLDFVRYHHHLKGTKIGCREGDCGACALLVGSSQGHRMKYQSMTSCLMPLANAHGKHIVTIEGINPKPGHLTPVQQALVEENGTQCGFCTVGFIMSLTGYCLEDSAPSTERAISAIDGNICRCTGYKSIERTASRITDLLQNQNGVPPLMFAVLNGIVPDYFSDIGKRLQELQSAEQGQEQDAEWSHSPFIVGGGTDLYVQQADVLVHTVDSRYIFNEKVLKSIIKRDNFVEIGGSATLTDLLESPLLQKIFPRLQEHLMLISSTPIRNMATIAGNLVNASPIGDMTIWLLALQASVVLRNNTTAREIPLREFYLGYKVLSKTEDEVVENIRFPVPSSRHFFNFEKVSKRTYLDIATVNTAIQVQIEQDHIVEAHLSAGGVAPVPLYLKHTSAFLTGTRIPVSDQDFTNIFQVVQEDIRPISDVRGSAQYKHLLLQQLIRAHFQEIVSAL